MMMVTYMMEWEAMKHNTGQKIEKQMSGATIQEF